MLPVVGGATKGAVRASRTVPVSSLSRSTRVREARSVRFLALAYAHDGSPVAVRLHVPGE